MALRSHYPHEQTRRLVKVPIPIDTNQLRGVYSHSATLVLFQYYTNCVVGPIVTADWPS